MGRGIVEPRVRLDFSETNCHRSVPDRRPEEQRGNVGGWGREVDHSLVSHRKWQAVHVAAVTVMTAGHAPIFFANPWEAPKAPR